jgi:hypothetical protein
MKDAIAHQMILEKTSQSQGTINMSQEDLDLLQSIIALPNIIN